MIRGAETVEIDYRKYPVLVVDDEPDILSAFKFNYEDEFDIFTASSGAQGLELMKNREPAVIVADQRMPSMSGTEFLERSMDVSPDAVRVILTGYTDIESLIEAINKSRIFRYITKPWEPEELRMTLRRAAELFHLTRENTRLVTELAKANQLLRAENAYLRDAGSSHEIVGHSPAIR